MGWIGEKIEEAFEKWLKEILSFVLEWINKLVFNIPESKFVDDVMDFFLWFTGVFAVVLVLYKIIEYIINTQNGTQEYPLDEVLLRALKSAAAMLILPWILRIIVFEIALPIADYFTASGTDFDFKSGYPALVTILGGIGVTAGGGIVLVLFTLFFVVVFLMFLFSVCVFYADLIVMQVLIGPVSLSMIADDNNYFKVWWRELLSQVVSLLVKLFLVTLIINIIFSEGNALLAIGAGALIIKQPSALKNMWYASGGMKSAGNMMGMSSRHLVMNLMRMKK